MGYGPGLACAASSRCVVIERSVLATPECARPGPGTTSELVPEAPEGCALRHLFVQCPTKRAGGRARGASLG
eukprot:11841078-Alexandrium_andersonii.AAC.1